MKIFITGGTGFLGYYIIQELVNSTDYEITLLRRPSSNIDHLDYFKSRIKLVEADLADIHPIDHCLAESDVLIHAAADIDFNKAKDHLYKTNVSLTGQLMDLALANDVQKVVHVSSTAALGKAFENKLLDEEVDWEPSPFNTYYAETKYLAELEVWRSISEGLNAVMICPSQILGTGDFSKGTPHLLSQLKRGIKRYPTGTNGFVDVRDVASMIYQAVDLNVVPGKYICSAVNIDYWQVLDILCYHLKAEMPTKPVTDSTIQWLKWIEKIPFLKSSNINAQSLKVAQRQMKYDNAKSLQTFNFEYRDITSTLEQLASVYLQWLDDDEINAYLL